MNSKTEENDASINSTEETNEIDLIPKETIDKSMEFLKKFVKESNIPGQNHLDVTLVDAKERDQFYTSMSVIRTAEKTGQLASSFIKETLGLS